MPKFTTSDAGWSIELSSQVTEPLTSVDESQDLGSAAFVDHASVCFSIGRDKNNNLPIEAHLEG